MRRGLALLLICSAILAAPAPGSAAEDHLNLRTSPLVLLMGLWNLRADFRVSDNWTIGPQAAFLQHTIGGVEQKVISGGIGAVYFGRGTFTNGFYMDFSLFAARERAASSTRSIGFHNYGVRGLLGHHWFWHPANLNLGAGLSTNSAREVAVFDNEGREVGRVVLPPIGLALDVSVGVTF